MVKKIEDTYTVRQSALALGVTVKRVRQMLIEGKLTRYSNQPVTIRQIEVLELREKRKEQSKTGAPVQKVDKSSALVKQLSELLTQSTENNRRAIEAITESNRRVEETLIGENNRLRGEIEALKASKQARKWFRR